MRGGSETAGLGGPLHVFSETLGAPRDASRASWLDGGVRRVGLIRSRGHVPKGGYDVPNGSNHTSAVTPAIQ